MTPAELRSLTLLQARDAVAAGEVTSEALVGAAVEQARQFDGAYALFITPTFEQAMDEACEADRRRSAGNALGPLHGVPVTIKDNIDTAGTRTTGGAKVFAARVPVEDAIVVSKLKEAGAISLGKTNLHEMALGGTSTNPHYGAVRNPWDPARIPGGSSGGAAAAQSLQIGYGALGTDSAGSVRIPAALCGLVGLKQSHGLVSLRGCMPTGTWSTDHIGPLTRTVADAALLLQLMQGYDAADPDSSKHVPSPAAALTSLNGVTIGVPEHYFWEELDPVVERVCRDAVAELAAAGARLVPATLETIDLLAVARASMMAEAFLFHEPYLRDHAEDYGEDIRYRLLAGQVVLATDYIRATRARRLLVDEISAVLATVDALVMPTVPIVAPPIGASSVQTNGKEQPISAPGNNVLVRNTSPFNQAGVPAISIPAGLSPEGLPVGLQLATAAFQDLKLLALASYVAEHLRADTTPPPVKAISVAN